MLPRRRFGKFGPIVGAIDEGTSCARFLAFAAETSEVLTYHQVDLPQIFPKRGWVEQDPLLILKAVQECVEQTTDNLRKLDIDPGDLVAIGIANQRETTVVWDKLTGKPLYNAIVWLDLRSSETVDILLAKFRTKNQDVLKNICGLPVHPAFSALKLKWLIDNIEEVQIAITEDRCLFGTIDSWLIWNLTGGPDGGTHVTDVSNASRTMLMNLATLSWDDRLLSFFSIPRSILPEICSSSEIYGYLTSGSLAGIPISGCLGDQQSALVGQMCFEKGTAKNSYGTGSFLLYNTGKSIVKSSHGLLTTVACQLGRHSSPIYALEGSAAVAGAAFKWLVDNINVLGDVSDAEELLKGPTGDAESHLTFVPAFSGLYAPYWRKDARGVICDISMSTGKKDIVRAAFEAVCFQTVDILDAVEKDCGVALKRLLVDGGMTVNSCLMQLQADLAGIPVVRASISEATALGAAIVAGMAEGVKVWRMDAVPEVCACDTFYPRISQDERDVKRMRWKMAIARSFDWEVDVQSRPRPDGKSDGEGEKRSAIIGPALFALISIATLVIAKHFSR